jgi:hypothetical protein
MIVKWCHRHPRSFGEAVKVCDLPGTVEEFSTMNQTDWDRLLRLAALTVRQGRDTVSGMPVVSVAHKDRKHYDYGRPDGSRGPAMAVSGKAYVRIGWAGSAFMYSVDCQAPRAAALFGAVAGVQDLRVLGDASVWDKFWQRHDFTEYSSECAVEIKSALRAGKLPSLRCFVSDIAGGGRQRAGSVLTVDGVQVCVTRALEMMQDLLMAPDEEPDVFTEALWLIQERGLVRAWARQAELDAPLNVSTVQRAAHIAENVVARFDRAVATWEVHARAVAMDAYAAASTKVRPLARNKVTGAVDMSRVELPSLAEVMQDAQYAPLTTTSVSQLAEALRAATLSPGARYSDAGAATGGNGGGLTPQAAGPAARRSGGGRGRHKSLGRAAGAGPDESLSTVDISGENVAVSEAVLAAVRDTRLVMGVRWAEAHPAVKALVCDGRAVCYTHLRDGRCSRRDCQLMHVSVRRTDHGNHVYEKATATPPVPGRQ